MWATDRAGRGLAGRTPTHHLLRLRSSGVMLRRSLTTAVVELLSRGGREGGRVPALSASPLSPSAPSPGPHCVCVPVCRCGDLALALDLSVPLRGPEPSCAPVLRPPSCVAHPCHASPSPGRAVPPLPWSPSCAEPLPREPCLCALVCIELRCVVEWIDMEWLSYSLAIHTHLCIPTHHTPSIYPLIYGPMCAPYLERIRARLLSC